MYFCGYFVLSNGPNWEYFSIILMFGSFWVQIWVFDLPGFPVIGLPRTVMQLILKIASRFDLKVFLRLLCDI